MPFTSAGMYGKELAISNKHLDVWRSCNKSFKRIYKCHAYLAFPRRYEHSYVNSLQVLLIHFDAHLFETHRDSLYLGLQFCMNEHYMLQPRKLRGLYLLFICSLFNEVIFSGLNYIASIEH